MYQLLLLSRYGIYLNHLTSKFECTVNVHLLISFHLSNAQIYSLYMEDLKSLSLKQLLLFYNKNMHKTAVPGKDRPVCGVKFASIMNRHLSEKRFVMN